MWNYSDKLPGSAVHGTREEVMSHYREKLAEKWLSTSDIWEPLEKISKILQKEKS